ncbi:MAG TPA: type II toxin-antitoxin system prevent-host-death family antitoxin [Geminicoccaceae bacterium]|nr:type II toxin-antitoxin system prevent-host-death family antitoxin [Geminicoccaceae bacterium]
MTSSVDIRAARARLSELVERAEEGESTIITRNGREVARLAPPCPREQRQGGWLKGEFWMADDFDDTPEEIIRLFEGEEDGS